MTMRTCPKKRKMNSSITPHQIPILGVTLPAVTKHSLVAKPSEIIMKISILKMENLLPDSIYVGSAETISLQRPTEPDTRRSTTTNIEALRLGVPCLPSYLGQAGSIAEMNLGVSYSSAHVGIIFSSGSELGQHISLPQKIDQVTDTVQQFIVTLGQDDLISKSLFYISSGSNDYIHYYLLNASNVQAVYLPWSFNQFLAQMIKQEIKNLYNDKVRKVVVMGLAPIGCAPYYLWLYSSKSGECIENINDMILEFSFAVRHMVSELNEELVDATIIFCDAFEGSVDIIQNHDRYGFNVTYEACCGLGEYKGWIMCVSPEMTCNNASTHIWWDQFHPTDAVNAILADNVCSSLHTRMCYPMNLQDMLAQNTR